MFNLADILKTAQASPSFPNLAGQFGLPADQAAAAMDALLPAFALGMNRAAASPTDFAGLFAPFAAAKPPPAFGADPMQNAAALMQTGQQAMTQIFGSNELTNAIAAQTATMTGMGQEMMAKMMPVMAGVLMNGLVQGAMKGQNPLGGVLASALGALQPPAPAANPMAGLFDMMAGMMGGFLSPKPQPAADPTGLNALMEFAQKLQAAGSAPAGEASGPRTLGQQAADTWTATMGRMFEAGREMQEQQLSQMVALFDKASGGARK